MPLPMTVGELRTSIQALREKIDSQDVLESLRQVDALIKRLVNADSDTIPVFLPTPDELIEQFAASQKIPLSFDDLRDIFEIKCQLIEREEKNRTTTSAPYVSFVGYDEDTLLRRYRNQNPLKIGETPNKDNIENATALQFYYPQGSTTAYHILFLEDDFQETYIIAGSKAENSKQPSKKKVKFAADKGDKAENDTIQRKTKKHQSKKNIDAVILIPPENNAETVHAHSDTVVDKLATDLMNATQSKSNAVNENVAVEHLNLFPNGFSRVVYGKNGKKYVNRPSEPEESRGILGSLWDGFWSMIRGIRQVARKIYFSIFDDSDKASVPIKKMQPVKTDEEILNESIRTLNSILGDDLDAEKPQKTILEKIMDIIPNSTATPTKTEQVRLSNDLQKVEKKPSNASEADVTAARLVSTEDKLPNNQISSSNIVNEENKLPNNNASVRAASNDIYFFQSTEELRRIEESEKVYRELKGKVDRLRVGQCYSAFVRKSNPLVVNNKENSQKIPTDFKPS